LVNVTSIAATVTTPQPGGIPVFASLSRSTRGNLGAGGGI
jgi:hypothetical protein